MARTRAWQVLTAGTLLMLTLVPTLAAAGFDCAKAYLRVDFVICRSEQAMAAQSDLSAAWDTLQSSVTPDRRLALLADQRAWIKAYTAECGLPGHGPALNDPTGRQDRCVIERIRRRAADLRTMATGSALPGAADNGQDPAGVDTPAGTPAAGGSTYPVDQLLQPTGGLRPLRLRVLDGRVVVNDPGTQDLQAFMRLVALGMRPGLIEEGSGSSGQPQQFASDFLPFSNRLRNLGGADEFQAQDNQRAFLDAYADRLRALAPRVPFEFVSAVPYDLPTYDASNGGFELPRFGADLFLNFNTQGVTFSAPFQYPRPFWSMTPGAARDILAGLENDGGGHSRQVRLVAVFRAVAAEPQSLRLDLRLLRLSIYDARMGRELYRFGSAREQAALSGKGFADLTRPPPGIQPWVLQTFDKLPIFDPSEPFVGSNSGSSELRALATLIAAGNMPGVIEANPAGIGSLFLTEDVKRGLFDRYGRQWNGEDEFERASSKQTFFDRYAPLIRQVAPKPPFRFIFTSEASVQEYDQSRQGFPIGFPTDQLRDILHGGGLGTDMQFAWPDVFWRIEPGAAHAALSVLREPGRAGARSARSVRVTATLTATAFDPDTHRLQLRLNSLRVYTPDLTRLIYDIPVINDAASLSAGQKNNSLQVPSPVVFDNLVACVELIDALGDRLAETDLKRCWDTLAARDADFYKQGGSSEALAANDARRPFFPRNGLTGTRAERDAFVAWAKSYAAGLPDTVLTTPINGSSSSDAQDQRFPALPGADLRDSGAYKTVIAAEGLQGDQMLRVGSTSLATPMLFVLPNRVSAYGLSVPKTVLQENVAWNATAQTTFRLGRPRVVRDDAGKDTVVFAVTPIRTVVALGPKELAQRSYEDVVRLDPGSFTGPSAAQAGRPSAAHPIRLDAAAVDLLMASTVGDRLSPEALTYMVVRRWVYENSAGGAPERRFFSFGKRAPTIKEALDLAPAFTSWAIANTPPLPAEVTLTSPLQVSTGQTTARWGSFSCLSGSISSLMNSLSQTMAVNGDLNDCRRRGDALTSTERRQCAALAASQRIYDYVQPLGGDCHSTLTLKFGSDPLVVSARLSHDLPVPALRTLGGKADLSASVTLTVKSVDLFDKPPSPRDLLPDEIAKALRPGPASDARGEYVMLNTDFVGVRYMDPGTHAVVAALGPETGAGLASIVHDYETATADLLENARPKGVYGPDLIGIRLGMSFEAAEQAIRQHMDVGKVLKGARAFDAAAQGGAIHPLTSGALFVSRDGHEMIALLDEPPAATGKVLAAWRRILIPSGTLSPSETLEGLKGKYGPPKAGSLSTGGIMQWFTPPGARCTGLYAYGRNLSLAEGWSDNGGPASLPSTGGPARWPPFPEALFDIGNERYQSFNECGPVLTAYYLEDHRDSGGTDQLDMVLTDIGPYVDAYTSSRRTLRSAAAAKPAEAAPLFREAYGPDMVGVRLGMSFAEAEAAVRRHMGVGRVFEGTAAGPSPGEPAVLPGTGKLFVSEAQDELVALLDAPAAAGQVVAAWRKVYSPLNIDQDLVLRRSIEKYGQPTFQADDRRVMAWGPGPTACNAQDASTFASRVALDMRWSDEGAPFSWQAVNGDDAPTMPVVSAANNGIPAGQACGPRVRLSFRPEQGNPPMNVTETLLSDPGTQIILLQSPQRGQSPTPVKF